MPVTLTYPGVYIEEIPSGVRTITGVSTSTTAFVGRTRLGPLDTPVEVNSFGDFARSFGGIWDLSPLSFSVQQYFQNGGQKAVIVRVANGAAATRFAIPGAAGDLLLDASSPGLWGDNLQISIDTNTTDPANLFNITVNDPGPPTGTGSGDSEVLRNLSADPTSPRFLTPILEQQSRFVRVAAAAGAVNEPNPTLAGPIIVASPGSIGGDEGSAITDADINDPEWHRRQARDVCPGGPGHLQHPGHPAPRL